MEEVNKMNNDGDSFWLVMKEGEEKFEGLYEVLVYKDKQRIEKGDFYDPFIFEHVQLFCGNFTTNFEAFELWLYKLSVCFKNCPNDRMAKDRLLMIWQLSQELQHSIQKTMWMPFDMPAANNQHF